MPSQHRLMIEDEDKAIAVDFVACEQPVCGVLVRGDGTLAIMAGGRGMAITLTAAELAELGRRLQAVAEGLPDRERPPAALAPLLATAVAGHG